MTERRAQEGNYIQDFSANNFLIHHLRTWEVHVIPLMKCFQKVPSNLRQCLINGFCPCSFGVRQGNGGEHFQLREEGHHHPATEHEECRGEAVCPGIVPKLQEDGVKLPPPQLMHLIKSFLQFFTADSASPFEQGLKGLKASCMISVLMHILRNSWHQNCGPPSVRMTVGRTVRP